jgi:hypothetical protein
VACSGRFAGRFVFLCPDLRVEEKHQMADEIRDRIEDLKTRLSSLRRGL